MGFGFEPRVYMCVLCLVKCNKYSGKSVFIVSFFFSILISSMTITVACFRSYKQYIDNSNGNDGDSQNNNNKSFLAHDKTFKYFSSIFIYLLWLMRHFISIYAPSLIISLFIVDKYSQRIHSNTHTIERNQITSKRKWRRRRRKKCSSENNSNKYLRLFMKC